MLPLLLAERHTPFCTFLQVKGGRGGGGGGGPARVRPPRAQPVLVASVPVTSSAATRALRLTSLARHHPFLRTLQPTLHVCVAPAAIAPAAIAPAAIAPAAIAPAATAPAAIPMCAGAT